VQSKEERKKLDTFEEVTGNTQHFQEIKSSSEGEKDIAVDRRDERKRAKNRNLERSPGKQPERRGLEALLKVVFLKWFSQYA